LPEPRGLRERRKLPDSCCLERCLEELAGRVFAIVKPKLGVVYHHKDEEGLSDAVRKEYNGPFVIAKDLMVINIGKTVTWDGKSSADTTPDGDKSRR
jgi:hypothetical protein